MTNIIKTFYFIFLMIAVSGCSKINGKPWVMHTIDNDGFGADGVRVLKNGDSTLLTVSWEQSGFSRCYVFDKEMNQTKVYTVPSIGVEDAITMDLDNDGILEIITFQEEPANKIQVHKLKEKSTENQSFQSIIITKGQQWMYGEVYDFNNDGYMDIVAGSKRDNASITLFLHPSHPKENWKAIKLCDAGWVMSIKLIDIDFDGHKDILFSDRYGKNSGIKWLKNPGLDSLNLLWKEENIGLSGRNPMFLNAYYQNSTLEIYASELNEGFYLITKNSNKGWKEDLLFERPKESGEWTKDIALEDLDKDGQKEIITVYNKSKGTHGIIYSKKQNAVFSHYAINGKNAPKFDLVKFVDMDLDGDLDVLNTEENDNSNSVSGLGLIWYENPLY